jgi:hypothetical protein
VLPFGALGTALVKRCGCGRAYTELEFLALALPRNGREWQVVPPDPEDEVWPEGCRLRFRNCACGSTITLEYPFS